MLIRINSFLPIIVLIYLSFADVAIGKLHAIECKMEWLWISKAILSIPHYKKLFNLCSKKLPNFDDMQHYQSRSIDQNTLFQAMHDIY
ncbi:hypothetical protein X798_08210 [Onchocerca flexuosa]|uniref:Uncharacterized protein n=1 Tax=Onchocerca flexuosa TaxID=387005 RepID=A0A238BJU1_9BILA|nr:hypothetical protein X798_08210 [Onchocerca flexuosa]